VKDQLKEKYVDASSDEGEEEHDEQIAEEKKFQKFEARKNELITKEFAYAVIDEMKSK
jgi:hypothetical protein